MSYRRPIFLALAVSAISWSSWVLFSTSSVGFGMSEATLGLLGDALDLIQTPLRDADGNRAESPRFSVMPMPGFQDIPSQASSAPVADDSPSPMFSDVFVVSLPSRADRRADMERLRNAIPVLNFSYCDATPSDDRRISTIYEHVRHTREAYATSSSPSSTFAWPDDVSALVHSPLGHAGADLWTAAALAETSALSTSARPEKDTTNLDPRPRAESLTCASKNYVSGPPYHLALPPYQLLTHSKIACWYSHVKVLRAIAERHEGESTGREVALILEDDIDVERDVHDRLRNVWDALPEEWDMLFLGELRLPPCNGLM